jgi:hypothetical protein
MHVKYLLENESENSTCRCRRRWEDVIKMDLKNTGREGVAQIHLHQDRAQRRALVNAVMNLRVP